MESREGLSAERFNSVRLSFMSARKRGMPHLSSNYSSSWPRSKLVVRFSDKRTSPSEEGQYGWAGAGTCGVEQGGGRAG